ncbi:MAG: hypothetical protein GX188_01940 [Syntrophomonadaceae bacterium]|jgi:hypothetical protein|nr:hypothetical protein [Thermoanaerobacterales bacterium]NLN20743.1 hypothetical protein [Syntrophomonadaceae bacterium]HAF18108.1 hypothetical protein [Peptococcaceae bacterium]
MSMKQETIVTAILSGLMIAIMIYVGIMFDIARNPGLVAIWGAVIGGLVILTAIGVWQAWVTIDRQKIY